MTRRGQVIDLRNYDAAAPPAVKPQTIPIRQPPPAKTIAVHILKAVIVIAGAVGFLSLDISLPERVIGIYFIASVVYAIDSQRTFLVAVIFLLMVGVWSAFGNNVQADSYAIFAFYFLIIGLVSAMRELISKRFLGR